MEVKLSNIIGQTDGLYQNIINNAIERFCSETFPFHPLPG